MASWRATSSWYKGVIQAPHDVPPYVHHYRPSYGQFNDRNVYPGWCNEWNPYGTRGILIYTRPQCRSYSTACRYGALIHDQNASACPLVPSSALSFPPLHRLPPTSSALSFFLLPWKGTNNRTYRHTYPSILSKSSGLWRGQYPVSCCTSYELTLGMQTYQGFPFILPLDSVYQTMFPWFTPVRELFPVPVCRAIRSDLM